VIPDLAPGISADAMARQRAESDRFLRLNLQRNPRAPNLVVKPRVPVRMVGVDDHTEPDVLVASDSEIFYRSDP
jgi:hypothetical protein